MIKVYYFIPLKVDVTESVFNKSINADFGPLGLRENKLKTKIILKFYEKNIPFELLQKGYTPYSVMNILIEMKEADWLSESI